jgi:hypothetical protein
VATVLAVGLGAVAYFSFVRGSAGSGPSPSPTVDIHSKEAVMAAVRHYYRVIDEARATGRAELLDSVAQKGSTANNNLRQFLREQAARNRKGLAKAEYFDGWAVQVTGDHATAQYTNWSTGHDIDATTSAPLEADLTTAKGRYSASLTLSLGRWLITDATLVQDNVP